MNINWDNPTYGKLLYKKVNILKIEDLKKDYDKLQVCAQPRVSNLASGNLV